MRGFLVPALGYDPSVTTETVGVYNPKLRQWLVDTCAGGLFHPDKAMAVEYGSQAEAWAAIDAAEMERTDLEVLPLMPVG